VPPPDPEGADLHANAPVTAGEGGGEAAREDQVSLLQDDSEWGDSRPSLNCA
jgi:hypothetical protein